MPEKTKRQKKVLMVFTEGEYWAMDKVRPVSVPMSTWLRIKSLDQIAVSESETSIPRRPPKQSFSTQSRFAVASAATILGSKFEELARNLVDRSDFTIAEKLVFLTRMAELHGDLRRLISGPDLQTHDPATTKEENETEDF